MSVAIKFGINCILVAGLTIAGILVFASLPQFTLEPIQWAGQQFDRPTAMAFWFGYTTLIWAVLAAVIALCMLFLKPGNVVLYGLVSAATFIAFSQPWFLASHGYVIAFVRELILVLTIPLLYWMFAHLAGRRHIKRN